MRITNGMMSQNLLNNLQLNMKRMNKLNMQAASGKLFENPSDDPVAMSKSLKLYTDVSRVNQYERNLRDAESWLSTTEDALHELGEILHRARELSVDMANGTKTEQDTRMAASEIVQLKDQVIKLANTTHAGRSIFTGYQTDKELLLKGADGEVTYNIDLTAEQVSVYNVGVAESLEVNTLGGRIFGAEGTGEKYSGEAASGDKSTMIELFNSLSSAMGLSSGGIDDEFDQEKISSIIGDIDDMMGNLLTVRAEIGAKSNRLEMTSKRLSSEELNFTDLLSKNEDVDQSEVIMKFKMAEAVYNASLAMGGKTIQPSLVDFIR